MKTKLQIGGNYENDCVLHIRGGNPSYMHAISERERAISLCLHACYAWGHVNYTLQCAFQITPNVQFVPMSALGDC